MADYSYKFKIIDPVTITDAMYLSCSEPETVYAEWNIATAYVAGNTVSRATLHKVYECVDPNTGFAPESNLNGTPIPKWKEVGATNKWACFDTRIGTQLTAADSVSLTVRPGLVDSIALLNMTGAVANVSVKNPATGTVIYNVSQDLVFPCGPSWEDYFFTDPEALDDLVMTDLPRIYNTEITVTITGTGAVGVGVVAVGKYSELGDTQYSPVVSIRDFSRKEKDTFGYDIIVQRAYSKRMDAKTMLPNMDVDRVARSLAKLRAKPVVYIGSDNRYSSLIVYGFYNDFSIDLALYSHSYCTLSIEGLV